MVFISQKPGDIHHPGQFLRRKQRSLKKQKKYLRAVKEYVTDQDHTVKDAIMIAQDELATRFPTFNDTLTDAQGDTQQVIATADRLRGELEEFETVFEQRLENKDIKALSGEQLQNLVNSLNEAYATRVN